MEVNPSSDLIRVEKKLADNIELHGDELFNKFHLRLFNTHTLDEKYVTFNIEYIGNKRCSVFDVQKYVDYLCEKMPSDKTYNEQLLCTGEDSSYDSDFEGSEDTKHSDVSRTASDTLGEEFAEYSTNSEVVDKVGYKTLVEFGMKLGYTEQLVQTALHKLDPNPDQNELLAELIKLGALQNRACSPKLERQLLVHAEEPIEKPTELKCTPETTKFRPIVIDGSNVAMSHGNRETFSCRGIKICVDWFRSRGITELTVFVPKWRKESPRLDNPVVEQEILHELEKERLLVFTPSREVRGKRMVCYDDRYILKLASENDGIVVSNDNYRDLVQECPEFRKVVEERILMYTFVNDRFMPPDDPLGRSGPTLDNFLKVRPQRKAEICPYGKKCTYGNKCKYNHPERGVTPHKSISETLMENAQKQLQVRITDKKLKGKSLSLPLEATCTDEVPNSTKVPTKKALSRAQSTSAFKIEGKDCDNTYKERGPHGVDESYFPCMHPAYVQPLTVWQQPQWRPMYESKNVNNQPEHSQRDTANNLHRKLQRQLSINPVCDPRIFQMQRNALPILSNHQPVSRNYSYQDSMTSNSAGGHLNVTRISSAPSSNQNYPIPLDGSFISSSDPHLSHTLDTQSNNNCISYNNVPMWPISGQQSLGRTFPPISSAEDARRKIHYHLSSIFPIEQVDAVMQLYPNETNAQKICSLILSMFPSKLK